MGCIEMRTLINFNFDIYMINRNMGCIEIDVPGVVRGGLLD